MAGGIRSGGSRTIGSEEKKSRTASQPLIDVAGQGYRTRYLRGLPKQPTIDHPGQYQHAVRHEPQDEPPRRPGHQASSRDAVGSSPSCSHQPDEDQPRQAIRLRADLELLIRGVDHNPTKSRSPPLPQSHRIYRVNNYLLPFQGHPPSLSLPGLQKLALSSEKVLLGAYGGLRIGEMAGPRRKRLDLAAGVVEGVTEMHGHCIWGPPKTTAGRRRIGCPGWPSRRCRNIWQTGRSSRTASSSRSPTVAHCGQRASGPECGARRPGPLGLEGLRIHDLRHTAVALWIAAGAGPKDVATRAGHTSVSFTHGGRDALVCWVGWWACQDLNLGPHPSQRSTVERRAIHHSPEVVRLRECPTRMG